MFTVVSVDYRVFICLFIKLTKGDQTVKVIIETTEDMTVQELIAQRKVFTCLLDSALDTMQDKTAELGTENCSVELIRLEPLEGKGLESVRVTGIHWSNPET